LKQSIAVKWVFTMDRRNPRESHEKRREHRAVEKRVARESKQKIRELERRSMEEHYKIEREMFEELHRLHPDNPHYEKHRRERSFEQYYKRIKYGRPFGIVFIVLLWTLLFAYGGFHTGLGIVMLIFAILSTIGYFFQIIFFSGLQTRILKPVERLKKGMDEIAGGNYDVKVDAEGNYEMQSLIRGFNAMAEKLKENEKLQSEYEENRKQLIASISHDLKTPITSVLGYIEAISDAKDIPAEKMERYLRIIHNNIAYMNRLIDDLFLFSKLDMQKLAFEFADTPVAPFVSDIMEELALELTEKGIGLIYRDELSDRQHAKIDGKRFNQVVRNIVDNAAKYGAAAGLEITARLYNDGDNIYLDIANNGTAIPEDKLKHIFDRFYRLDTARTKDITSTGLGLAIAKELVEAHGGTISVLSDELKGTCFTISLPVIKKEDDKNGR
jgi:signal transduction histidine kinase